MFTLPKLNFEYDALEPYIDAKTMEIHYTKHHQGYVNKLNMALDGLSELQTMSIEELLTNFDKAPVDEILKRANKKDLVRNNGGGHANHSLFWSIIKPSTNGVNELGSDSKLRSQIDKEFGNLENCIKEVSDAAVTQFGSGWGWLALDKDGKLEAVSTANQDSPYLYGKTPILGIDVWEHAYYLNYQNKRADYVKAFWSIVNWVEVERRYTEVVS